MNGPGQRAVATDGGRPRSKVQRVIEAYDLTGFGEELENRWLGDGRERQSLRDLADEFNRRVLEAAMSNHGMSVLDGEADNVYRLLQDDDVSPASRTRIRSSLEREGIDVDDLQSDFVSHQAIHTYLTKHRGVSREDIDEGDRLEKGTQTIQRLQSRTSAVTENTLSRLRDSDDISLGEFDLLVDMRVICSECETQYDVIELLERGGCECE